MVRLLSSIGAYLGSGLLTWAGVSHAAKQTELRQAIEEQRVVPQRLQSLTALSLALLETTLGLVGIAAVVSSGSVGSASVQRSLAVVAAWYSLLACYSLFLYLRRPGVPCGCGHSSASANGFTVARGWVLAALAFIGAMWADHLLPVSPWSSELALAIAASLALGMTLWLAPEASQPIRALDGGRDHAHEARGSR
jgi:hypothetical protein